MILLDITTGTKNRSKRPELQSKNFDRINLLTKLHIRYIFLINTKSQRTATK